MRLGLIVRRVDMYLALLLMGLCFGGWMACYERIRPANGSLASGYVIRQGPEYYQVLVDSQCVGTLSMELLPEGETVTLKVLGEVKAEFGDHHILGELNTELTFNVIGQFIIGFIDTKALGTTYRVVFKEIDPIQVKIQSIPPRDFEPKEFFIPGPLELRRTGSKEYLLFYRYLKAETSELSGALLASLGSSLRFTVQASSAQEALKCRESTKRIQLKPLINELRKRFLL